MPGLAGLQGLYGSRLPQFMDQGVLEARASPGTATSHHEYGSQSLGYGGPVPQESPEYQMEVYDAGTDQEDMWGSTFDPGIETAIDHTPTTHEASWPAGIVQPSWGDPDAYAKVGEQNRELHGADMGGVEANLQHAPAGHEEVTHYTTSRYDAPNQNILAKIPAQLRGSGFQGGLGGSAQGGGAAGRTGGNAGGSNADPDQGYGVLNTLDEFQHGHSIRRVQHDRVPWDFTLLKGEQDVPFYGRHDIVGQMSFDGPDSPYYQAGNIQGNQIPWEARIGDPTTYQQPPEPRTLPAGTGYTPDVWSWG